MNDRKSELGNEPITRLLIRYSTPAMLAMFVNSMYNLVDTIFVGQGAGTLALAGLAVSFPIQMIVLAAAMAVGIGTASVVSRSLGAGDQRRAERAAGTSFVAVGSMSLFLAIAGLTFLEPLLRLFGATDDVLPYASDYLSVILLGSFFFGISVSSNNIVRSEGNAKVAMTSMILGAGTNVILDPIFIFGFDMGIRGAAVATIIANVCTFTYLCRYFLSDKTMLRITRKDLIPDFEILSEVLKIGSASFFRMVVGSLTAIPINFTIIQYGSEVHLAILGVANRALMFFFMPIFGLVQGLQPIVGFNYGARDMARVKEAVGKASVFATCLSVLAFLILMFATKPILSMFSRDPALISEGTGIIRILIIFMPFVGFQMVGGSLFQALGKPRPALVIALLRQVLILVPLIVLLPRFYGIQGLWVAFPIADFVSAVVTIIWVLAEIRALNRYRPPLPITKDAAIEHSSG